MDGDGWDLAPKKGRVYKLAVDTGECSVLLQTGRMLIRR